MNYLFNSIHYTINFYGVVLTKYHDTVQYMKAKAFEHKLIYCASYDLQNQKYIVNQNYDTLWCILYFYITNYLLKLNYAGLSYTDLGFLVKVQDVVIITSYVLSGKEYVAIYDEKRQFERNIGYKIVYAVTDKNDDLTHAFNLFKQCGALYVLTPQHVYNILTYYTHKHERKHIQSIKFMRDDNFEETLLST